MPPVSPSPAHVAIVGSGPSGFFAAEALLRAGAGIRVDMLDRLPTPFGLVRGGVAPDHPRIKSVAAVFDRIARTPGFRFFGNVDVGADVGMAALRGLYHAVILACGAERDVRLGIPGEDLAGSHAATEFVGWYNGQPGHRERRFDLSHEVAMVVGQGNVAADIARILATPHDRLAGTDIAGHALQALAESRVTDIHIIGRRGPAQSKLSTNELRELGEIEDCAVVVDERDLVLEAASALELEGSAGQIARRNVELWRAFAARRTVPARRRIHFHFLRSPLAVLGASRVEAVRLGRNRLEGAPFHQQARPTGEALDFPCGLVFRSVGYRGAPLADVPFDSRAGVVPCCDGRVLAGSAVVPGLYAAGWIKRGPSGIIGTNRADSIATATVLLADLPALRRDDRPGGDRLSALLAARGVRATSYADWLRIDAAEVRRGGPSKPREKFTRIAEMLGALDGQHDGFCGSPLESIALGGAGGRP